MNENIYKLKIPDHLIELIRGLHPHLKKKVRFSLEKVVNGPYTGKALKEELAGFYSYRVGNFRIIYRISERKVIELVAVGPRRSIYEETLKIIRHQSSLSSQSGISAVLIVGVLLILSILGAVIISVITTESETSLNEVQSTKAYYIAQGGIEYGLYTTTRGGGSWGEFTFANRPIGNGSFTLKTYTSIVSGKRRMTMESVGRVSNPTAERKIRASVDASGASTGAITYFGSASNPVDNASLGASPVAVTPPASMLAGDLVVMIANTRTVGITPAISASGGQAWTSEAAITTNGSMCLFWCRYNGTWTANPSLSFSTSVNTTVVMHVFRPTSGTNTWALDVAQTTGTFPIPPAPRDVTITGITTVTNGALALFVWSSRDNNTWGLQTAGWTNAGAAYYRNRDGNDSSQSAAYRIIAAAGATGNVINRELTTGGGGNDNGVTITIAFKEVAAVPPGPTTIYLQESY